MEALMHDDLVPGAQTTSIKKNEDNSLVVDDDSTGMAARKKAMRKALRPAGGETGGFVTAGAHDTGKTTQTTKAEPRKLARR